MKLTKKTAFIEFDFSDRRNNFEFSMKKKYGKTIINDLVNFGERGRDDFFSLFVTIFGKSKGCKIRKNIIFFHLSSKSAMHFESKTLDYIK